MMILAGLTPTAEEIRELQQAGWSLILTSDKKMSAIRKDGSSVSAIPWDKALNMVRFP